MSRRDRHLPQGEILGFRVFAFRAIILVMSFLYLGERFVYRIIEFVRHWYVKSGKLYSNFVLDKLSKIDEALAWKITLRHLFEPLYKDYSLIGYFFGFLFRSIRLLVASAIYLVIFAIAITAYVVWLLIPPFVLWNALFVHGGFLR